SPDSTYLQEGAHRVAPLRLPPARVTCGRSSSSSMVRSILSLRAQPGRGAEGVPLFEELGILREASVVPGFVAAELQAVADDPDELLVTATWRSAAAYDAWLEGPVRDLMRPAHEALVASPPVPRVDGLAQPH